MTVEELTSKVENLMERVQSLELKYVDIQAKFDQLIDSVHDLIERVKKLEVNYADIHVKLNLLLWGVGLVCGGVITLLLNALLNGVIL